MWRVPGQRITLDLDGPSVEVEPIRAWAVQYQMLVLVSAFNEAKTPTAEYAALVPLFDRFISEAQPTWEITDHRGTLPATAAGMVRLPLPLSLSMVTQWLETLEVPEAPNLTLVPSAVDAVIPPGPVNREIKKRLRKAKAA